MLSDLTLAKGLGIETFATVGNEEKADVIRQLGGTPINYKTENFAEVLKQQGGVVAVLDLVGASYFQGNIDSLRQNGRLFLIGFMGGNIAENVDLLTIALKRIHITGSTMRCQNRKIGRSRHGKSQADHEGNVLIFKNQAENNRQNTQNQHGSA